MTLSGLGCRLQTCSCLATEWFNSTFRARRAALRCAAFRARGAPCPRNCPAPRSAAPPFSPPGSALPAERALSILGAGAGAAGVTVPLSAGACQADPCGAAPRVPQRRGGGTSSPSAELTRLQPRRGSAASVAPAASRVLRAWHSPAQNPRNAELKQALGARYPAAAGAARRRRRAEQAAERGRARGPLSRGGEASTWAAEPARRRRFPHPGAAPRGRPRRAAGRSSGCCRGKDRSAAAPAGMRAAGVPAGRPPAASAARKEPRVGLLRSGSSSAVWLGALLGAAGSGERCEGCARWWAAENANGPRQSPSRT